jgi:hypothetical protein
MLPLEVKTMRSMLMMIILPLLLMIATLLLELMMV